MTSLLLRNPLLASAPLTLVTPRQAKHHLQIGATKLAKMCREGELTPIKFGRRCTRFRWDEIETLIEAHAQNGGAA